MKTITITVANQKGGVGKTATTISIGHGLARRGCQVLLVDCDPQATVTYYLGLKGANGVYALLVNEMDEAAAQMARARVIDSGRENLWILPGGKKTSIAQSILENEELSYVSKALDVFRGDYDYIIMDTSPSIGGLQERAIIASDYLIIPASTEAGAVRGVAELFNDIGATLKANPKERWQGKLLGILPTFFIERNTAHRFALDELKKQYGEVVLPPIHLATAFEQCVLRQETIFEMDETSRAAQEYARVVEYILSVG